MLDTHAHVMQVKLCKANTRGVTVRVVILHLKKGVQLVLRIQINKQRVRVFKLIIFKLTLCSIAKFELLCMDLLPSSSLPASLVIRVFVNGAKIPATGLVEVSPSVHVLVVSSHSLHVPLESLLPPPTLPYIH